MEFQDKILKCIDCGADFIFTAFQFETEHSAIALLLAGGDIMSRVGGKARVKDLGYGWVSG